MEPSRTKGQEPPILKFIWRILKEILKQKKYYLLVFWLLLAITGALIFLTGSSTLLPAIYMAF